MVDEILRPKAFVMPSFTTVEIDSFASEVGTMVFDTTIGSVVVCGSSEVGSASWESMTSLRLP